MREGAFYACARREEKVIVFGMPTGPVSNHRARFRVHGWAIPPRPGGRREHMIPLSKTRKHEYSIILAHEFYGAGIFFPHRILGECSLDATEPLTDEAVGMMLLHYCRSKRHDALYTIGALTAVFAVGACRTDETPTGPRMGHRPSEALQTSGAPKRYGTIDDSLAALSDKAPGFGGTFTDETGALTVYLTKSARQSEAMPVIRAFLARQLRADLSVETVQLLSSIKVRQGTYTFRQLYDWYFLLTRSLDVDGVVLTDIDESRNRIAIGVLDTAAGQAVLAKAASLGIPGRAVVTDITKRPENLATLQSYVRPVAAGLQIAAISGAFTQFCTHGFTVRPGLPGFGVSGSLKYFMTNSHCTAGFGAIGVTTGTQFGQPVVDSLIGTEVFDPPVFTSATDPRCPVGKNCRYSDAALIEYDPVYGANNHLFAKVHTTSFLTNIPSPPTYHDITGQASAGSISYGIFGTIIKKVGRTTGTSTGYIKSNSRCVDYTSSSYGYVLLCQYGTTLESDHGDSGSPVFTSSSKVAIGMLWGKTDDTAWMSDMSYILSELGQYSGVPSGWQLYVYNL